MQKKKKEMWIEIKDISPQKRENDKSPKRRSHFANA